jgi:2-haloacid dehalogenase
MDRAKIPYTTDDVYVLVAAIELRCFPEVPDALARLHERCQLVVLSNGDPDMLEATRAYHGIPLDAVISVVAANSFMPALATYQHAASAMNVAMDEVLFVADHEFDCVGAKLVGMRTVFINRRNRPFGATPHQPDVIVRSMTELADLFA